jgi:hypothetical protein
VILHIYKIEKVLMSKSSQPQICVSSVSSVSSVPSVPSVHPPHHIYKIPPSAPIEIPKILGKQPREPMNNRNRKWTKFIFVADVVADGVDIVDIVD